MIQFSSLRCDALRLIVGFATTLSWLCAMPSAGCARIDARADYQRAAEVIRERTAAGDVFVPDDVDPAAAKVDEILRGPFTVDAAVRVALLNNPDFQSLFDQIGASRADVVQSGLIANPNLTLVMLWPEGGGRPKIVYNMLQDIVDLWQIPVKKKIAERQLEQVVNGVVHKGIDIATETRVACYRHLAARQAEKLARENFEFVRQTLQLAERSREQKGRGVDVKRVRALMLETQLAMLNADREVALTHAALGKLLGINRRSSTWDLADELPRPQVCPMGQEHLVEYAMSHRMDAVALAAQVEAARGQLQKQMLAVFPRVVIGPAGEQKDTRGVPGRNVFGDTLRQSTAKGTLTAPTIQSRGQRHFAESQIIDALTGFQLQMTVPIWDQNQAQIAKAAFAVSQRIKEYDALMNMIAQDVEQAVATSTVAAQLVQLYEAEIIPQGRSNVEAAEKAYEAGEQSITALIEAKRFLLTQTQADLAALRDCAVAAAQLERAVGGQTRRAPAATQPATSIAPEENRS